MARYVRSARVTPQRRKLVWAQTTLTDTAFAVTTNRTTDLLAGFIAAGGSTQGVTVMRIHCAYSFRSADVQVNGSRLVQGFCIGNDGNDPVTAPHSDWLTNVSHFVGRGHGLLTGGTPNVGEIDVRSKRKCDEVGDTLFHSMKYILGAAGAEDDASYQGHFRVLLALP